MYDFENKWVGNEVDFSRIDMLMDAARVVARTQFPDEEPTPELLLKIAAFINETTAAGLSFRD